GSLESTNRPLDIAIQGDGFFRVRILDTVSDGTAYTRNGNFDVNAEGELILNMGDGYRLIPPVNIPPDATEISISTDGVVEVLRAGSETPTQVGQLQIAQFVNPQGLKLLGGSLYIQTEASGDPII